MPEPASEIAPSARPDTVIAGRYKIVRAVGRGGMGAVYEAVHTWTGRRVALKTLLPHIADDAAVVERFRREARAGVQGAHPNIVEVLDMGVDHDTGTLYLAQEFLVGEDLSARLSRERRLPLRDAYELLIPAMAALDAAHRAGVVHRDVKPANLFVARSAAGDTITKVIDFGIAALADSDAVTRTGVPVGTPQYMAPEQARGARDLDARTDVWSMGAVWFEALTGERPIDGAGYHEVMSKLLAGAEPGLDDYASELALDLRGAVEGALRVDRRRRYASMSEFARALLTAPSVASQPWLRPLVDAHTFSTNTGTDTPDLAVASTAPAAPVTLDLPTPAETAPGDETPPARVAAQQSAPPISRAEAPVSTASVTRQRWPIVALVTLALITTGALLTRAPDRPAIEAPTPTPLTQPTRGLTPEPAAAPLVVEAQPAPAQRTPPSAMVDASAPPSPARRAARARPTQQDASNRAPQHAGINGAPVLEP